VSTWVERTLANSTWGFDLNVAIKLGLNLSNLLGESSVDSAVIKLYFFAIFKIIVLLLLLK